MKKALYFLGLLLVVKRGFSPTSNYIGNYICLRICRMWGHCKNATIKSIFRKKDAFLYKNKREYISFIFKRTNRKNLLKRL